MKADNGFQDNYSVVVASGTWVIDSPSFFPPLTTGTCFYLDYWPEKFVCFEATLLD